MHNCDGHVKDEEEGRTPDGAELDCVYVCVSLVSGLRVCNIEC
jgi:hypothetical protein